MVFSKIKLLQTLSEEELQQRIDHPNFEEKNIPLCDWRRGVSMHFSDNWSYLTEQTKYLLIEDAERTAKSIRCCKHQDRPCKKCTRIRHAI
jgi:hypothetical protein